MSAKILRRAAARMRERAEAVRATAAEPDQWFGVEELVEEFTWGSQHEMGDPKTDAEHIASWPPAVALAVAEVLDTWADLGLLDSGGTLPREREAILAVARAYLGESA